MLTDIVKQMSEVIQSKLPTIHCGICLLPGKNRKKHGDYTQKNKYLCCILSCITRFINELQQKLITLSQTLQTRLALYTSRAERV
jgi:hypothetical protein